jgi:hypothetical protein
LSAGSRLIQTSNSAFFLSCCVTGIFIGAMYLIYKLVRLCI